MALGSGPVLHASESFLLPVKTPKEMARNSPWGARREGALPAIPPQQLYVLILGKKALKKRGRGKKRTVGHFKSPGAAPRRGLSAGRRRGVAVNGEAAGDRLYECGVM